MIQQKENFINFSRSENCSHMQSLSKKSIGTPRPQLICLLCLVPGRPNAALQEDPQIFQEALKSKFSLQVLRTFVTLKTMGMMWSKDKQLREVAYIEIGKELLRRVQTRQSYFHRRKYPQNGDSYNTL